MVLFRFSSYYIFAVQIAFYFLRFEDKTCPHVTMATDFVGLMTDVMWTRKYTYFHYFCSSNQHTVYPVTPNAGMFYQRGCKHLRRGNTQGKKTWNLRISIVPISNITFQTLCKRAFL